MVPYNYVQKKSDPSAPLTPASQGVQQEDSIQVAPSIASAQGIQQQKPVTLQRMP